MFSPLAGTNVAGLLSIGCNLENMRFLGMGRYGLFQKQLRGHGNCLFSFEPTKMKVKKTTIFETSNSSSRGQVAVEIMGK